MAFYNTFANYVGDDSTTDFAIPFSYIKESDVVVTRQGGAVSYIFLDPQTIRISAPLATGDSLKIERDTSLSEKAVVFNNGSPFTAGQMNTGFNQLFNAMQEASDTAGSQLGISNDGQWDALSRRITNLPNPTSNQDAATKAYVDSAVLIQVEAGGSLTRGAVARPLIQILRDTPPSISDFGGSGDGSTSDTAAARSCLDTYGVCYLPYYKPGTYTRATWYFGSEVRLLAGQCIIGSERKSLVKQAAGDNVFVFREDRGGIKNIRFDASAQTSNDVAEVTILLDTTNGWLQDISVENVEWGIEEDKTTLKNGYNFISDIPHASNKIVGLKVNSTKVWGAKGYPVYFTQVFADSYFDRVLVDWTRQSTTPTVPAFSFVGGEGIFFDYCVAQGWGTVGSGDPGAHAFSFSGGSALGMNNCRGDNVGGNAFRFYNVSGIELATPIGSLCGEDQFVFDTVTRVSCTGLYAGGRNTLSGAANKSGLYFKNTSRFNINISTSENNTGDGVLLENVIGSIVSGSIGGNTGFGVRESGSSNYNGVTSATLYVNGAGNGYFTGASSFIDGVMRNSGVGSGYSVPGAGTSW